MYHFLRGIVTEKITEPVGSERLILDVSGVGYEIYTGLTALGLFGKKGDEITVYTTLITREDGMTLFGFPTLLEKELFSFLHSVSGVGPKTALNILSGLTVSEVCHAIISDNSTALSQAQGIGAKTANRIVLELKEKIKNWSALPLAQGSKAKDIDSLNKGNAQTEARSVLQALGYSVKEINDAFANANGSSENAEDLVHFSLKWLATSKK